MIKNERHSHAAKMLARARELYKVYQNNLELAKYNLRLSRFDPYDRFSFSLKGEIEDCKYMINQLQKEIREWKQEIYKAQTEYHKKKLIAMSFIEDFELLNRLRELEARRIQTAYKTASNELEKLDEMTEKDLLKVIAAKLIMIEEKLNTLPLNL